MPAQSPDCFGPYEVVALLGAGGMGEVYRARDPRLNRDVAIKVLARAGADPVRRGRLLDEAQAASALNHPNIITVYDVGTRDGTPFIVSELIEGVTLRQMLARAPLPTREVLDLGVQMAEGLAAAHQAGIVHRDFKPENVMVTRDCRAEQAWMAFAWGENGQHLYGVRLSDDYQHLSFTSLDVRSGVEHMIGPDFMALPVSARLVRGMTRTGPSTFLASIVQVRSDVWLLEGFLRPETLWDRLSARSFSPRQARR